VTFKHRYVPRPREVVLPPKREVVFPLPKESIPPAWRDKPTRKIVRDRAPLEADE
jgi:hypothetical protein